MGECLWALLMLSILIYGFSMVITSAAMHQLYDCADCNDEIDDSFYNHFGTMESTAATLFQSVTGGLDWSIPAHTLVGMGGWRGRAYAVIFYVYVSFNFFVVFNVLTAIFCEHAIEDVMGESEALLEAKLHTEEGIKNKLA